MGARVRTINKIGNGRYFTTSWKVNDYLICNILYFVFFYSYFLIFKYLVEYNYYASIFAYVAFFSMNSRRGPTSSPINIEKI